MKARKTTYPVLRLLGPPDRLHDAALLVLDVAHPVGLARRDEDVGAPALDVPVQDVALLDLEVTRVLDGAARAVVGAVVAVDVGRGAREQIIGGRRLGLGVSRAVAERELPRPVEERLETQRHLLLQWGHRGGVVAVWVWIRM